MGLLDRLRRPRFGYRVGEVYDGLRAHIIDPGVVPWPGTYAIEEDGTPLARLDFDVSLDCFVVAEVIR